MTTSSAFYLVDEHRFLSVAEMLQLPGWSAERLRLPLGRTLCRTLAGSMVSAPTTCAQLLIDLEGSY